MVIIARAIWGCIKYLPYAVRKIEFRFCHSISCFSFTRFWHLGVNISDGLRWCVDISISCILLREMRESFIMIQGKPLIPKSIIGNPLLFGSLLKLWIWFSLSLLCMIFTVTFLETLINFSFLVRISHYLCTLNFYKTAIKLDQCFMVSVFMILLRFSSM